MEVAEAVHPHRPAAKQQLTPTHRSRVWRSARRPGFLACMTTVDARPHAHVLLDIGLPFVDGWRLLSGFSTATAPAVIVISARGEESDKVRALDLGAAVSAARTYCPPPPERARRLDVAATPSASSSMNTRITTMYTVTFA